MDESISPTQGATENCVPNTGRNPKWLHNPEKGHRSVNYGCLVGWARPPILHTARMPHQELPLLVQNYHLYRPGCLRITFEKIFVAPHLTSFNTFL